MVVELLLPPCNFSYLQGNYTTFCFPDQLWAAQCPYTPFFLLALSFIPLPTCTPSASSPQQPTFPLKAVDFVAAYTLTLRPIALDNDLAVSTLFSSYIYC